MQLIPFLVVMAGLPQVAAGHAAQSAPVGPFDWLALLRDVRAAHVGASGDSAPESYRKCEWRLSVPPTDGALDERERWLAAARGQGLIEETGDEGNALQVYAKMLYRKAPHYGPELISFGTPIPGGWRVSVFERATGRLTLIEEWLRDHDAYLQWGPPEGDGYEISVQIQPWSPPYARRDWNLRPNDDLIAILDLFTRALADDAGQRVLEVTPKEQSLAVSFGPGGLGRLGGSFRQVVPTPLFEIGGSVELSAFSWNGAWNLEVRFLGPLGGVWSEYSFLGIGADGMPLRTFEQRVYRLNLPDGRGLPELARYTCEQMQVVPPSAVPDISAQLEVMWSSPAIDVRRGDPAASYRLRGREAGLPNLEEEGPRAWSGR